MRLASQAMQWSCLGREGSVKGVKAKNQLSQTYIGFLFLGVLDFADTPDTPDTTDNTDIDTTIDTNSPYHAPTGKIIHPHISGQN